MKEINPRSSRHCELRQAVRELCGQFDGRYWQRLEEQSAYPEEFVQALTKAGWLAALIPTAYGGPGLNLEQASVILEEVNRSGANSGACHAQIYIMGTLLRHGSEEQKRKYLPAIAAGELRLQSFAVTEPTTGSDTTRTQTFAERKGDRYIINGQKVWISRVQHSDLMLLLARTTPLPQVQAKAEGLSLFLIDLRQADPQQLSVQRIRSMVNNTTNRVFFHDLAIPADNLIGEEGRGFRYLLDGINAERILIAAECIGDGYWFVDKARGYAGERVVFDQPIGRNQGIQFPIARAYANLRAADLMRYEAAELFDAAQPCGAEANLAKLLAADASWEAANACLQTHGGFGFASEYDVERKFRETRLYQVAPISTNMVLAYIGEHVLGMPRSF
ncbi:MAG: acyl-CoA dehydrogenase family protein [Terriglobales bacterium]